MKLFPQPITSPSRLEKFPTPLTRSLRSNGRSKSRGRSRRLSPLFIRKSNGKTTANETQEPSSPRVTCFGQVRVRRSNQTSINTSSSHSTITSTTSKRRSNGWIQKTLLCKCFVGKLKSNIKTSRSVWRRWVLCFQMGCYHRKVEEIMEESANVESRREEETDEYKFMDDEETAPTRILIPNSPPNNALLLMRSRSENYRPSSLANLFWGSPLESEDLIKIEEEKPKSRKEPEIEEKLGFCEKIESSRSSITTIRSTKFEEELEKIRKGSDLPRVLRRSKSDPARISGEFELDSENYFWKRRRLGYEDQYPLS